MNIVLRAVASASRRLDRPELIAAIYPTAARDQREELAIRAIMAATLGRDSVYVDVGTNLGQLLRHAVHVAPAGRHVAFEPIPGHAAAVRADFPSVDCRTLAVGDTAGSARFCHYRALSGWSGLRQRPEITDEAGQPAMIDVRVVTLDAELQGVNPSLVKIDVEGGETAVVRGALDVLASARPCVIFEHDPPAAALYGSTSRELWGLLSDVGYRIFTVTGDGPFAGYADAPASMNWFARPS